MSDFEKELLYHAAPSLSGMKQANLFSFPLEQLPQFRDEVGQYQKKLASVGIALLYLYCCRKRIFLLVYREKELNTYLKQPQVQELLMTHGYPSPSQADFLTQTLLHLRKRISAYQEFPHEIGFFLGYPVEDVLNFIQQKGQNYKICGYWKVYGDVSEALRIFASYELCRTQMMEQVQRGVSLFSLLQAS